MSEKKVSVAISGGVISVDPETVQVKKAQDNVKWVSETGRFSIDLPGYTVTYHDEGKKHVGISTTFPTVGVIKYSVSAEGAPTLDPDVDVIP
jgi:hypothetical protein